MTRPTFLLSAGGAVVLGIASAWALAPSVHGMLPVGPSKSHARWLFKTGDLAEMVRYSDAVVVARHVRRADGRIVQSSNGLLSVPFELNDFEVIGSSIKGTVPATFTIERLRDVDFDGGAFEVGERYLLMLKRQRETDLFLVVNDEARYLVGPTNRLVSSARGYLAGTLRGQPLVAATTRLQELAAPQ